MYMAVNIHVFEALLNLFFLGFRGYQGYWYIFFYTQIAAFLLNLQQA